MARETIVLSVGGSLICTEEGIQVPFLKKLKACLEAEVRQGKRFIIVTGGGRVAREYQAALRVVSKNASKNDLDWVGIAATRLNAELVLRVFGKSAHERVLWDHSKPESVSKNIVLGAGWLPGSSSDHDAVILAKHYGAKTVVNMTNVQYVYDRDPRKHPDAKKITAMSWHDFRRIVGNAWDPGKHTPFDPIASTMAEREGMQVVILDGTKLKNFQKFLRGEKFQGTIISH